MKLNTIESIKAHNKACGWYFFEKNTLVYFGSRVSSFARPTPTGAVFVTSELDIDGRDRRYSVREINQNTGLIETLGGFRAYGTLSGAKKAAARYADSFK